MPQERVSRYAKSERIHQQQQMCATRDAKADPSGTRNKMIPDGNTDLNKGRVPEMATGQVHKVFLHLNLFKR